MKKYKLKTVWRAIFTAAIAPIYTFAATSTYAVIPEYARITNVVGPREISIRRGNRLEPADLESELRKYTDALYLPASSRAYSSLRFFDRQNRDLLLEVQADTKNQEITLYYLPCSARQGDTEVIQWNTKGRRAARGCERGIRVRPSGSDRGAQLTDSEPLYTFDSLKQSIPRGTLYYCTVLADSGQAWFTVAPSEEVCQQPLQQCRANGGSNCTPVTLDFWHNREQDLTALIDCANNRVFSAKGNGSQMTKIASDLWQQATAQGATFCAFRIKGKKDIIVKPSTNEKTLLQTINTSNGIEVRVFEGEAIVQTAKNPQGVTVPASQKYNYSGENAPDPIQPFNLNDEPIELQVFLAKERGYGVCSQQQDSGGQEGSRKTIQLTATEGNFEISYDLFDIPDRLQVIYEGRYLIDTGFVSGKNTVTGSLRGNSARVEVIIIGNPDKPTTRWNYTLSCPEY
ncbi:hypothetical protein [Oscillatoria salina]|uniref:hypothetical protein n=1 Tax=Oscillatoria salina TaxID=331517 RepID=UPI0013BBC718|nr:hypothetical protein [Oscillatoria salina]MBZ8180328.1 hypothetical protein [Oscillatoria salina IIICB1]NET88640.1 hypothetical protein [Kamptonema sp. SIO1D9]